MIDFIVFSTSVVNTADEEICPGTDWPSHGMLDYSELGIKRPAIFSIVFFFSKIVVPIFFGQISCLLHSLRSLRKRLQRDGVWCYTGKGNAWEYCSVPRCPPSPIDGHAEGPKNATELEQNGEEAINVATIILGTATLNVVILICLTFLKQRFQLHGQDDFMIDLFAPW